MSGSAHPDPSGDRIPRQLRASVQMMLDGLPEQAALIARDGEILARNDAWTQATAAIGSDALEIGENYFTFLSGLAAGGHKGALQILQGFSDMFGERTTHFERFVKGEGPFKGRRFKMVFTRISVGADLCFFVNRHDVTELLQLRRQRRRAGTDLAKAGPEERRQIAADLRHSTAQLLTELERNLRQFVATDFGADSAAALKDSSDILERLHEELGGLESIFRLPDFAGLGFATAIRQMAADFSTRTGITVETAIRLRNEVPASIAPAAYRIVQEALANIHRHAGATGVWLSLNSNGNRLRLAIRDNGIGPEDRKSVTRSGVGIAGMEERVEELGGRMSIRSDRKGTLLLALLPFAAG